MIGGNGTFEPGLLVFRQNAGKALGMENHDGRIVQGPLDGIPGAGNRFQLRRQTCTRLGALASGQQQTAPGVVGPELSFKQENQSPGFIDLEQKLSTFDHAVDERRINFQAAGLAAEKVHHAVQQIDQERMLLLKPLEYNGGILIDTQYGIVGEHHGDSTVVAGGYPILATKGVI